MKKKTIWWILSLLLPVTAIIYIVIQFVFFTLIKFSWEATPIISSLKALINRWLWLFAMIGILALIPWIILLSTSKKSAIKIWEDNNLDVDCIWERLIAAIIDLWLSYLIIPIFFNLYYYFTTNDTIGRKVMWIKIVNLEWNPPSSGSLIGRFFAKILSRIVLMLWYLWILFDSKHQWRHDKLANTLVIKYRRANKILAILLVIVSILIIVIITQAAAKIPD